MNKKLITLFVLLSFLIVGCTSSPKEGTVEGVVVDATMNTIVIDVDGKEYSFATENAEVVASERGLLIGDTVKVYYTGTLVETETAQTVTVTKIEVTKEVEVADENAVEGEVIDATMNTLSITTVSGKKYLFSTQDATINAGTNGILIGDTVKVTFEGMLDDSQESQSVKVTEVEVTKMAQQQYVEVTVVEATADSLKVKLATGTQVIFSLEGAEVFAGDNGFVEGDIVRIDHEGMLNEKIEMQSVQVKSVRLAVTPLDEN